MSKKEGDYMRIEDHLSKQQKSQLNTMRHKKEHKPKKPKEEKVDWSDIMGSNNRGMKRGKRGAMRNV